MCLALSSAAEPLWKAGVAKADITPPNGLWMAGYATRTKPAEGKVMELWIKALALEDAAGNRGVFLTSDTLGIPQTIYEHCLAALEKQYHLEARQVVLSASHTHCGPVLRKSLMNAYPLDDHQRALLEQYAVTLESNIVQTIGRALADLKPARLGAAEGEAGFAVNRRNNPERLVPRLIAEGALKGPVDHAAPVLAVYSTNNVLRALLFGYACHNTVMAFYKWSGDYAGFAQIALEKSHPEAVAMFFNGCGGDQNPLPRGRLELAERYGNMLAAAVEETLRKPLRPVRPELQTRMQMLDLDFGPAPTEAELVALESGKQASARRWATNILADIHAGVPLARSFPYPVQAWKLGSQLLITLGGEPVVDYSLKFKKEFGQKTWIAGYCNDVMTYIPSLRVLREGGYEGGKAMIPYGLPTWRWGDDVEDRITATVEKLVASLPSEAK
ncbi:MAG TPA: neutral/alkaline non-lysosomal ceramidase N-terminal domain-containing protein [Verrucomicrobiae bacterium]|nr:neutral/alkaline non-lysosomal ceramidase N-terminal domain-containing protein [Verrucomicrobiae bacterium]